MTQKEGNQVKGTHKLETKMEGQVRTGEERKWARGIHFLETTKGGTSQDTEKK